MSKPTDARSSAMASGMDGKPVANTKDTQGLGQIIECKCYNQPQLRLHPHERFANLSISVIPVFETFMSDVRAQFTNRGAGQDPLVTKLDKNVSEMKQTFDQITGTLSNYDEKLINVLGQHQDDFWFAFKTHMNKIETELQALQAKSKEQDQKLTQDVRIINLENQLKWYKNEFQSLMDVKEKNDEQIAHLKDQCKNLGINSAEMRTQVKAAKR